MKKYLRISLLLVLAAFISVPAIVFAQGEQTVFVPADQVIEGNYLKAANSLVIEGTIHGDVMVAGNTIEINGPVAGDVFAVGNSIKIRGPVSGSVRVAGSTVEIQGAVSRNVLAAGSTVEITNEASVGWDVYVAGAAVKLQGPVKGNAWISGASVLFNDQIQKNANVVLDSEGFLTLLPEAAINGSLTYHADNQSQLSISEGAIVKGETKLQTEISSVANKVGGTFSALYGFIMLISFFSLLVIGVVIVSLVPKVVLMIEEKMMSKPAQMMGWGFVWLIIVPVIAILLMVTLIGIPLALMILVLYLITLYLSQVFAAFTIGMFVFNKVSREEKYSGNLLWPMVAGLIIYIFLVSIPFVGWLIKLIMVIWSIGALFAFKREIIQEYR